MNILWVLLLLCCCNGGGNTGCADPLRPGNDCGCAGRPRPENDCGCPGQEKPGNTESGCGCIQPRVSRPEDYSFPGEKRFEGMFRQEPDYCDN